MSIGPGDSVTLKDATCVVAPMPNWIATIDTGSGDVGTVFVRAQRIDLTLWDRVRMMLNANVNDASTASLANALNEGRVPATQLDESQPRGAPVTLGCAVNAEKVTPIQTKIGTSALGASGPESAQTTLKMNDSKRANGSELSVSHKAKKRGTQNKVLFRSGGVHVE